MVYSETTVDMSFNVIYLVAYLLGMTWHTNNFCVTNTEGKIPGYTIPILGLFIFVHTVQLKQAEASFQRPYSLSESSVGPPAADNSLVC